MCGLPSIIYVCSPTALPWRAARRVAALQRLPSPAPPQRPRRFGRRGLSRRCARPRREARSRTPMWPYLDAIISGVAAFASSATSDLRFVRLALTQRKVQPGRLVDGPARGSTSTSIGPGMLYAKHELLEAEDDQEPQHRSVELREGSSRHAAGRRGLLQLWACPAFLRALFERRARDSGCGRRVCV